MSTKFFLVSNKVKKFKKSIEVDGDKVYQLDGFYLLPRLLEYPKLKIY